MNHPPHYVRGGMECIDAIEGMVAGWPAATGYRLGNVIKYLWRHRDKAPVESLKKARWYLDREIAAAERAETAAPGRRRGPTRAKRPARRPAKPTKPAKAPATKRPRAATADLNAARAKAYELFRSGKTLAEVWKALPGVKYATLWNWSKHDEARAA